MNDLGLFIDSGLQYGLKLENGDLVGDAGLETAVSISLFTDRRVTDQELGPGETEKKGWWGDVFPDVEGDQIGSRLWLLARAKRTQETLRLAEDYAREALQWMLDDGVAASITVTSEFQGDVMDGRWAILIQIVRPNGESARFTALWDAQKVIRG